MKTFDNIESRRTGKTPFKDGYYLAHSNLGVCRIYGRHKAWTIVMGNSPDLQSQGIDGKFVRDCDSLATVSEVIKYLSVRTNDDGRKYIACI